MTVGPHGTESTAMAALFLSETVLEVKDNRLTTNGGSFTIAFYVRTATDSSTGGLFEFIDSNHGTTTKSFQIQYSDYTVAVTANDNAIGSYKLLQRQSTWTFLAFAFDAISSKLTVFSEHGVAYAPAVHSAIATSNTYNNGGFRLGYSTKAGKGLNQNDAVSCFSFYSTALQWSEVKHLQEACRILHASPHCGVPKLPYSPIPSISNPPLSTVPKEGQFPWLGTIETEFGSFLCTVTILDEFWVLTSAECFDPYNINDYTYNVKVGVHDSLYDSSFTTTHKVAKFIKSGRSPRDIALAQLETPIDFTSDYVNDACLFNGDLQKIQKDQPQFVNGWGINGRISLISQTLPRYVVGNVLSDSNCSQSWGLDFDPSQDYCFISSTDDKNVPCKGDEGSPLMYQGVPSVEIGIGDHFVQAGLYYGRDDQCSGDKPGLFVDIHQYQDWISENMACELPGSNHEPLQCPQ